MATTYREAIQRQQKALQSVYDNAEGLRDVATEEEKNTWNVLRGLLDVALSNLYTLDNNLKAGRPGCKLHGAYIINT